MVPPKNLREREGTSHNVVSDQRRCNGALDKMFVITGDVDIEAYSNARSGQLTSEPYGACCRPSRGKYVDFL
jgi:hypothetical protein